MYWCDLCGAEFTEATRHGLCPACEKDAEAYAAANPGWEAEYEAWATANEGGDDMDAEPVAQVVQVAEGEWAIRDDAEGRLVGPFYSLALAEEELAAQVEVSR